ncbi:MAG: hypothetical protein LBD48_15225 [Treponema sp.]|jgi:diaminopimelate epimerase|nr:hypothetical protein [Treponema sp.]
MDLEIVKANPAGNITIFVLNAPLNPEERAEAVRALLADGDLKAEQVGFVCPPRQPDALWRLEMMGGEFCGNAARSFGLFAARQAGLSGAHTVMIETSGQAGPLTVRTGNGTAEIAMPAPLSESFVEFEGRLFLRYDFEGISHIIAPDIEAGEPLVRSLLQKAAMDRPVGAGQTAALGVMFYDTGKQYMRPAVWVRSTDTLIFESSCGSGSAALGVWAVRDMPEADNCFSIIQPGGLIAVTVVKRGGKIQALSIGGTVALDGPVRYTR